MKKVRKLWLNEEITKAKQLVAQGSSQNKASKECGIPKETLRRHVKHTMQKPGPSSALCKEMKSNLLLMQTLLLHQEIQ